MSYPDVNHKKKKIVRKEIKIARVDTSESQFVEHMRIRGFAFPKGGASIIIIKNGQVLRYPGLFSDVNMMVHQLQRITSPLVQLDSEEQILDFLDNSASTIWKEDYSGSLFPKGQSFD